MQRKTHRVKLPKGVDSNTSSNTSNTSPDYIFLSTPFIIDITEEQIGFILVVFALIVAVAMSHQSIFNLLTDTLKWFYR